MSKIFFIVLLAFAGCFEIVHSQSCPTPCGPYQCLPLGTVNDTVWSVVNGVCEHWQNRCLFDDEICNRLNQCEDLLLETTQENCIRNCPETCLSVISPVCASFLVQDEEGIISTRKETFNNNCELEKYVCRNGVALGDSTTEGECEE